MSEHSMTLTWNHEASENTKRVQNHRVAFCSCGFKRNGPVRIVNRAAVKHLERFN